ncbi:MAG: DUF402 domain-containing protein [Dehalococcoidia bacterium]|nr:DUF402 domain-containing protein [Dehalococcoidia bacterium]
MACQHTPPAQHAANAPFFERKRKPDGSVREYACSLLWRGRGLVVVRFPLPAGGAPFSAPLPIPPGSTSDGYFWSGRPYNLYRMRRPDGSLAAHRFDALRDVKIGEHDVSYRDLVLDWWVTPDDVLLEEDREELDELVASGVLSPADQRAALRAEQQVCSRYRHIVDEAAALERRLWR